MAVGALVALAPTLAGASETRAWLLAPDFAARARQVEHGDVLRLEDVPLNHGGASGAESAQAKGGLAPTSNLNLRRFRVFSPGAEVVVHGNSGTSTQAPPDTFYFRGEVDGSPGSMAYISVRPDGTTRGFVADQGEYFVIAPDVNGAVAPDVARLDPNEPLDDAPTPFACDGDHALSDAQKGLDPSFAELPRHLVDQLIERTQNTTTYSVNIAIETDWEYYNIFGDVDAATQYVGDLVAASSAIYYRDVNTVLEVGHLSLWTGGAGSDPWSGGSTSAQLSEFLSYWNANQGGVSRHIAHMLSGKSTGGGIAYVGVLCSAYYGYGVTANLNGVFSTTQPWLFWDILAFSHEVGHNFSSGHTHCYNPPVDNCYNAQNGCYSGAESVPSNGGGSIMSYCHTMSGGYNNIALWFGRSGYYGTTSQRVNTQMRGHVESRDWCLDVASLGPTIVFNGDPTSITSGQSTDLTWSTVDATSCTASEGWSGSVALSGTQTVSPTDTTSYTLSCTGPSGTTERTVSITVSAPAPTIDLTATPTQITRGQSTTLNWTTANADSCTQSGGWSGTVGAFGASLASPSTTETYHLSCTGNGGTVDAEVTVTVAPPIGAFADGAESGPLGWSPAGSWAQSSDDANTGAQSWTDSPGGEYANDSDTTLWSPPFNLNAYATAQLQFSHRLVLGSGDVAEVWIDDGTQTQVGSWSSSVGAWTQANLDVSAAAGSPSVRIGFRLITDSSGTGDGWFLDDLLVTGTPAPTELMALTPCRLYDSRDGEGVPVPSTGVSVFPGTGTCGVPSDARALSVVVTVVGGASGGYLTFYPGDVAQPMAAQLVFTSFGVHTSNAIVALPKDGLGDIGVYNGAGAGAHVIVDVMGYFR